MFYNEDLWPNRMEVLITLDQTFYTRIDIPWYLRIDADFQWCLADVAKENPRIGIHSVYII